MRKLLKALSMAMVVFLMSSVLAACGGSAKDADKGQTASEQKSTTAETKAAETQATSSVQEKVNLRYYTVAAVDKTEFDYAIGKWNEKNPNITVECVVLSGADGWDKIRTAIAGGESIDVCVMERETFRDKAAKMYLQLNDLMKEDGFDYLKEMGDYAKATMVDDEIYGISKVLSPAAVWLNKELLEKAGVSMPDEDTWTIDDYFEIMKKTTVRDADGKVKAWGGMHWQGGFAGILDLACYGGWDIVTDDGKPNVNSPILRDAAEKFYKAMFVDKSIPTDAYIKANKVTALFAFAKGDFATMWAASNSALFFDVWKVNGNLTQEMDDKDVIKLYNVPRWDTNSQPNKITSIVTSYSVTKSTKYPKEAYKFLKWYSTDCLVEAAKVAHRVPAWKGADINVLKEAWRFYSDKDGKVVQGKDRTELYTRALNPKLEYIGFKNRVKYSYSSMMIDELKKEMDLVLNGEKSIDDALNAAQKACEAVYEKEKGK